MIREERFWSKVDRRGPDECWEWLGGRTKRGYGRFRKKEGMVLAHRTAWELSYGSTELDVLHTCDNPPCCNPRHLFKGTNTDNVLDRCAKGRTSLSPRNVGQSNGNSKLTEEAVLRIIGDYASGEFTHKQLARREGVSRSRVGAILSGKSWRHVHA